MFNFLKWLSVSIIIAGILASAIYFILIYLKPINEVKKAGTEKLSTIISNSGGTFKKVTKNLPFKLTQLELAITEEEHQKGLMSREELCVTCGMLFVYNESLSRTFWMKNTNVSLDIIFLDTSFRVINIASNTKVNQITELYSSTEPAQYILEVPANWGQSKGIAKGSVIDFKSVIEN